MTRALRPADLSESADLQVRSFEADVRLRTLADIARALSARLSLDELLSLILDRLTRALDADRAMLFLAVEDSDELAAKVVMDGELREFRIQTGQGIAGWVAATGRGVNVKDVYRDSRFDPTWDHENDYRTGSMLCQPVFDSAGDLVAVVQVLNKRQGYFSVDDEVLLNTLMAMAAISIVNAKLNSTLVFHNLSLTDTRRALAEKVREIDLLYTLERKAGDAQDLADVVRTLLERIGATVSGSLVQIALVTPRRGMVVHRLMHGSPGIDVRVFEQLVGLSGQVIAAGQPLDVCELDADEAARLAVAEQLPFAPDVGVFLPLVARDAVVGALAVVEKPGRMQCLTEDDSKLMTLVSGQVARAIAQRQARDQAEREDRLESVGRALTGIMHDFRTPMTVASGYVQMFKYAEDPSERTELADKVLAQLARIQQMSKEVTAFARGEQTMLVRKVMVADFAHEAEELIGQIFHDPALPVLPVQFSLDCRFKGVARFDAFKLLRVVQNIARNARDALADCTDGRFQGVIDAEGDQLVLTFVDNGAGVPLAFRHRLFDPFATQGKKDGTGLGLAMVKQFAEAHGGGVAYRDTPGGGATFEIRIARESP